MIAKVTQRTELDPVVPQNVVRREMLAANSLAKLSSECVDRLSDGRGALQCRFLENAASSLFILFGP